MSVTPKPQPTPPPALASPTMNPAFVNSYAVRQLGFNRPPGSGPLTAAERQRRCRFLKAAQKAKRR